MDIGPNTKQRSHGDNKENWKAYPDCLRLNESICPVICINVLFNISCTGEVRPLVFSVGNKVSPTEDALRIVVQVTLHHVK